MCLTQDRKIILLRGCSALPHITIYGQLEKRIYDFQHCLAYKLFTISTVVAKFMSVIFRSTLFCLERVISIQTVVLTTSVHVHGIKNTSEFENLYQHYQQTKHALPHQDVDPRLGMCIFYNCLPMTHLCFQDLSKDTHTHTKKKSQENVTMPY